MQRCETVHRALFLLPFYFDMHLPSSGWSWMRLRISVPLCFGRPSLNLVASAVQPFVGTLQTPQVGHPYVSRSCILSELSPRQKCNFWWQVQLWVHCVCACACVCECVCECVCVCACVCVYELEVASGVVDWAIPKKYIHKNSNKSLTKFFSTRVKTNPPTRVGVPSI